MKIEIEYRFSSSGVKMFLGYDSSRKQWKVWEEARGETKTEAYFDKRIEARATLDNWTQYELDWSGGHVVPFNY